MGRTGSPEPPTCTGQQLTTLRSTQETRGLGSHTSGARGGDGGQGARLGTQVSLQLLPTTPGSPGQPGQRGKQAGGPFLEIQAAAPVWTKTRPRGLRSLLKSQQQGQKVDMAT